MNGIIRSSVAVAGALILVGALLEYGPATNVAAVPSAPTANTTATPSPPAQRPPSHLWNNSKPRLSTWAASVHQEGLLRFDTLSRTLIVAWGGPIQTGQVFTTFEKGQMFPVGFHPTDIFLADRSTIYVGGSSTSGRTVIERWKMSWPPVMPEPFFDASGNMGYFHALPSVMKVSTLYDDDIANVHEIRHITAHPPGPSGGIDALYVVFDDTGDLYEVNATNGAATLRASVTVSGSVLTVPELSAETKTVWSAVHNTSGHIVVLGYPWPRHTVDPPTIVIKDTDKDGNFDSYDLVLPDDWDASTYADASNFSWFSNS
ncbi:MAG: hypothetical protein GY722_08725 [bacterium]|nr:hypothetical protein [bacterium]